MIVFPPARPSAASSPTLVPGTDIRLPRTRLVVPALPEPPVLRKDRTMAVPSDLLQLAHRHRVSTEFHDWQGNQLDVPEETLRKILDAMGVDAAGAGPSAEGLPSV